MAYPTDWPTYLPKDQFLRYMEDYVKHFNISPKFNTLVESCMYDEVRKCWVVMTHNKVDGPTMYASKFLVVATGENSMGYVPEIVGLQSFPGETIHSSSYKSGNDYVGKSVLVVGCGNSGFEIAHDLAVHGANTSIIIRSPELIHLGMVLSTWHLPLKLVDLILMILAYILLGDLSKYGIVRPNIGPLTLKAKTGRSAVIDTGTTKLIKKGDIKVFGPISCIRGNLIEFADGNERYYDAIVFATGYKSTTNIWLKNDMSMLNSDGIPKKDFPNHWKGANGLYNVGFVRRGLAGIFLLEVPYGHEHTLRTYACLGSLGLAHSHSKESSYPDILRPSCWCGTFGGCMLCGFGPVAAAVVGRSDNSKVSNMDYSVGLGRSVVAAAGVCVLLRKARRRRLPEDRIKVFLPSPHSGDASSIIGGHVKVRSF
ncbi:probable indole-3-pyruvate monooxygenase YUCCA10 [Triticum aestivum]|uniref:probable indole-3-pyruvate monooxygenase YUCCA10 n=1 Tax=Triticum aestivum TaxID=4565 RepID=UPI001D028872|nr:probable indole-3-pyruvate monooxygenase YUCCA10 [Triticum aestivum]